MSLLATCAEGVGISESAASVSFSAAREFGLRNVYLHPVSMAARISDQALPPGHARNPSAALSMTRSLQMVFVLAYLLPGLPPLGIAHLFAQPLRALLAAAGSAWLLLPAAAIVVVHAFGGSIKWSQVHRDARPALVRLDRYALATAAAMGAVVGVIISMH